MKASLVVLGGLLVVAGIWTSGYTEYRPTYDPEGNVITEVFQPYEQEAFTMLVVGFAVAVVGAVVEGGGRRAQAMGAPRGWYEAPYQPIPRQRVRTKVMIRCPSCGSLNEDAASECVRCKKPLGPIGTPVREPSRSPEPKVTVLTPETPPSMVLEGDIVGQHFKTAGTIRSLNKMLDEGVIGEDAFQELKRESEERLRQIEELIRIEVDQLRGDVSRIKEERASKIKLIDELKARHLLDQLPDEDYEREKESIETDLPWIEAEIAAKEKRTGELQRCLDVRGRVMELYSELLSGYQNIHGVQARTVLERDLTKLTDRGRSWEEAVMELHEQSIGRPTMLERGLERWKRWRKGRSKEVEEGEGAQPNVPPQAATSS